MKYGKISLLLILVILFSFLTGAVSGYFDHTNPKGMQLPVTVRAAETEDEDEPEDENEPEEDEASEESDDMDDEDADEPEESEEEDPEEEPSEVTEEDLPQKAEEDDDGPEAEPDEEVISAEEADEPTDPELPAESEEVIPEPRAPRPEDSNPLLDEVFPDLLAGLDLPEDQFTEFSEAERAEAAELLRTADEEIFPRESHIWNFSESQGYVNEILEQDIIHQYYIYHGTGNDLLISMFPASEGYRTGNKRLNMYRWPGEDFHASYSLKRTENLPEGAGGRCWMQYDNFDRKGERSENGVILFPGDKAYVYRTVDGKRTYQAIADLSALDQNELLKFDFIRIDGTCWFYANGEFLFRFEDDVVGMVTFEGGSEIYKGGNRIHCEFDDFSMTYR